MAMIQEKIPRNLQDYRKCPYNPQHIVLKENYQRHIIRCMGQYPDFLKCPHNAQHRFPNKQKLQEHLPSCPSKKVLTLPRKEEEPNPTPDYFESREFHCGTEDWDTEYD